MHAAGMSHQEWRGVAVGDSEVVEIFHERSGLPKSKSQIQLETVGSAGDISRFSRSSVLHLRGLGGAEMLESLWYVVWDQCPNAAV
jgi:hypothetical protein